MTTLRGVTALALGVCVALTCTAASALTEQQVVERARKFLRDIGRQIPADAPTVSRLGGDREPGSWKVEFGHKVRLEVSDLSFRIMAFADRELFRSEAALIPISSEEAKRFAIRHMEAAGGLPEGAVSQHVKAVRGVVQPGLDPKEHPTAWVIIWRRQMGAYRVVPDALVVHVDAATGRLSSFRNSFITPVTSSMEPLLTRQQAEATARREVPQARETVFGEGYLYVHGINCGPSVKTFRRSSVLAWQLNSPATMVSVDARTGDVLGVATPRGRGGVPSRPMRGYAPGSKQTAGPTAAGTPPGEQKRPKIALALWVAIVLAVGVTGGGSCLVWLKLRRGRTSAAAGGSRQQE